MWVADFTYIRIAAGFCFLAAILDACSRKVVGYAISRRIDTQLALAALDAAVKTRQPLPGLHPSHRSRVPICKRRLPKGIEGIRPSRIDEFARQPVPQCPS